MIIAAQQNDVVKEGFEGSKKATINQDKVAKLQYLLTRGLYTDPISAVLTELTNNAIDSVTQSGKNPLEYPVIVSITRDKLVITDKGLGLNKYEFENVCMSYLTSTKEQDNSTRGAWGIGMKSFLALDKSAIFICRKDKKEYKYLAYQGEEFLEYDLLYEKDTEEENGVTIEISIDSWNEYYNFSNKAKKRLAYYDEVLLYIDNNLIQNEIIRSEDWQYSTLATNSTISLCLKDVYYDIDYSKIGISPIYMPISLRFNLEDNLIPVPSRESLIMNTHSINLIKEKIKKVALWFVNKYNEQTPDERELLECFQDINKDSKSVKLANEEFTINDLIKHSSVKPKELKIKGISLKSPHYYWGLRGEFLNEYETVAHYERGTWRTKHVKHRHSVLNLLDGKKHIEVSQVPTGRYKTYLLEKYKDREIIFIKKVNERRLGTKLDGYNSINYRNVLELSMVLGSNNKTDKSKWRGLIQEFCLVENSFKSLIVNEVDSINSVEFITWLEKQKEIAREDRKNNPVSRTNSNYTRLNKGKEDFTIQLAVPSSRGICKFEKKVIQPRDVNKLYTSTKALHIYFTEEEKEKAIRYYRLLHKKYSICIISPRELKRLKQLNSKQFMTETEFQSSNAFCKLMTSLKFDEALDEFDTLYRKSESIISNVLKPFEQQRQTLKLYVENNGRNIDNDFLDTLKEVAKAKDLYDHSLDDVYNEFNRNIKKYEFINCLSTPRKWHEEEYAKYQRTINCMLLMKKKYNNFEDLEITVTNKKEVESLETV